MIANELKQKMQVHIADFEGELAMREVKALMGRVKIRRASGVTW